MTDIRERRADEEPMGIVISRGSRAESPPRFAAYVWSQVGENVPAVANRAPHNDASFDEIVERPASNGGAFFFDG